MTFIGTAGWSIPKLSAEQFPTEGSSLARYAATLAGVEVNSSFYKRHKPDTWQRWADSVPDHFRFSVKVPKKITHELRLIDAQADFDVFLADIAPLGKKLGPILLQLPPKLAFDEKAARMFLTHVRTGFSETIVIEPRHESWADTDASSLLTHFAISRVHADPAIISMAEPASAAFFYLRLHGSPKIYYSQYNATELQAYATILRNAARDSWCIFDNTASGAALVNALEMRDLVSQSVK